MKYGDAHKRYPIGTLLTNREGELLQVTKADTLHDMFALYHFNSNKSVKCSFYVMTINVEDKYWKVYK